MREFRYPHNRIDDTPDALSYLTVDGSVMQEANPPKQSWKKKKNVDLKYIDDIMSLEHLAVTSAYNIFSTNKPKAIIHAQGCERFFSSTKANAEQVGMYVNDTKTQLLCISSHNDREVDAYIRLQNGRKIEGQQSLKQLGFTFSNRPSISAHIDAMSLKFRKRLWYLRHLMYKCFLLSVLDYASVVYGPMVNKDQEHKLEMLQATALRIIYGQKKTYSQLIDLSGVEKLSDRRERLIDRFIKKASEHPRFADDWFPRKQRSHHDTRNGQVFLESFARTTRLYNSPIYHYRRRMNFLSGIGK